jgi:hypothetical protein
MHSPLASPTGSSYIAVGRASSMSTLSARSILIRASVGGTTQLPRAATAPSAPGHCRRRGPPRFRSSSSLTSTPSSPSLLICRAKLKLIESFDANLPLDDEKREALFLRLSDPGFCAQVSLETTKATKAVEFANMVFTPVPYSTATPKGMPPGFEVFANDTENYVVINVPPTLTFKANVLGKRVCAIYKIVGDAE